jgi:hypothetical protein
VRRSQIARRGYVCLATDLRRCNSDRLLPLLILIVISIGLKQDQEQEQEADLALRLFSEENSRFREF